MVLVMMRCVGIELWYAFALNLPSADSRLLQAHTSPRILPAELRDNHDAGLVRLLP